MKSSQVKSEHSYSPLSISVLNNETQKNEASGNGAGGCWGRLRKFKFRFRNTKYGGKALKGDGREDIR